MVGEGLLAEVTTEEKWNDERKQQCEPLRVLHLRPTTQHIHKL